jgi:hypothetical protein
LRRSLMTYQEELDEKTAPRFGLAPGPLSEAEESLLRFVNTLTLVGMTGEELLELEALGSAKASERGGDPDDLVAMFVDGFLLAKYIYFREAVPVDCQA